MPNLYKELPQNYHSSIHTHSCPQNWQNSPPKQVTWHWLTCFSSLCFLEPLRSVALCWWFRYKHHLVWKWAISFSSVGKSSLTRSAWQPLFPHGPSKTRRLSPAQRGGSRQLCPGLERDRQVPARMGWPQGVRGSLWEWDLQLQQQKRHKWRASFLPALWGDVIAKKG